MQDSKSADVCFADIPLKVPAGKFLDPVTHLIHPSSNKVPCLAEFLALVRGIHHWFAISPKVRVTTPPRMKFDGIQPDLHPLDKHTGLYTCMEFQLWEALTRIGSISKQITAEIGRGACVGNPQCSSDAFIGIPKYSLSRLATETFEQLEWSPWTLISDILSGFLQIITPIRIIGGTGCAVWTSIAVIHCMGTKFSLYKKCKGQDLDQYTEVQLKVVNSEA